MTIALTALKVFLWIVLASLLYMAVRRLFRYRRLERWEGWRSLPNHAGNKSLDQVVYLTPPLPECGVILSADTTMRLPRQSYGNAVVSALTVVTLGGGIAWLSEKTVPPLPMWGTLVWYLVWIGAVWLVIDRRTCTSTYVGTDGAMLVAGEVNRRGTAGYISMREAFLIRENRPRLRVRNGAIWISTDLVSDSWVPGIRRPPDYGPSRWRDFSTALINACEQFNWSYAVFQLALIEIQGVRESQLPDYRLPLQFPVIDPDDTLAAWSLVNPQCVGPMCIGYTVKGLRVTSKNQEQSQVRHEFIHSQHRLASVDQPSVADENPGHIGGDESWFRWNETEVEFRYGDSPESHHIPFAHIANAALLRRLLDSRLWKDGLACLVREELREDELNWQRAGWSPTSGGTPFRSLLPHHRAFVWYGAQRLIENGLLTGVDSQLIESVCRSAEQGDASVPLRNARQIAESAR